MNACLNRHINGISVESRECCGVGTWHLLSTSWGAWVAQSVEVPTLAQVMISWFVSLSPMSGFVLTAQILKPASDPVSPSLCSSPAHTLSLSLSKINIKKMFLNGGSRSRSPRNTQKKQLPDLGESGKGFLKEKARKCFEASVWRHEGVHMEKKRGWAF